MNGKKIVVTGGAGFIGSHLVDRLVALGAKVHVIDDLSGVTKETAHFNPQATYSAIDIAEPIGHLIEGAHTVYHLAAESRIIPAIENPLKAVRTNILGTANVLQTSRVMGVKRVIYSSTSAVYGLTEELPTNESCAIDCLNPYSTTKYSGEELCKVYSKLYGLDTAIFRYFNVYGERSPTIGTYAPVVGIFLKQRGGNLTVVGDGRNRRDFIHVSDVVEANILVGESNHVFAGRIFNIGSGKNYEILDVAKMISDKIVFVAPRIGEARNTLADTTAIHDVLGWKALVNLEDWIKEQL